MKKLLLASSSLYRRALLEQLGLVFDTTDPAIDETALTDEPADELVARLSRLKARAPADRFPHHLIIGSDQVCCLKGEIMGKPGGFARAVAQLQRLSGQTVEFYTGICLYDAATEEMASDVVTTAVQFQPLSDARIRSYLEREQPYDCAGSFKSEGLGISLFERITADDPSALVGLPLIRLTQMLASFGQHPLDPLET